jgi:8-oxo-dGTP pyrophosphatase MutT (NUDIX family)
VKREFSAGGVVVRNADGGAELAAVVPREGVLALPKGHPEEGESMRAAATREVREETGLTAEPGDKLGDVRYWYTLAGERVLKVVSFYLFEHPAGDLADHDDEVLEARWIPLAEAPRLLSYDGERKMARAARERFGR